MSDAIVFSAIVVLALMLFGNVISFFVFKSKVYKVRKDIFEVDLKIQQEKRLSLALESDYILKHRSDNIKKIADNSISGLAFTKPEQSMSLNRFFKSGIVANA